MIKFSDNTFYFGFKKFKTNKGIETNWKTYESSSKYIKEKLELGIPCKWIILNVFDKVNDATNAEREIIKKYWKDYRLINKNIPGTHHYIPTENHILGCTRSWTNTRKITHSAKQKIVQNLPAVIAKKSNGTRAALVKFYNCKPVYQFTKDYQFIKKFDSVGHAAFTLNLKRGSTSNINACVNGKLKFAYGFYWSDTMYIDSKQ